MAKKKSQTKDATRITIRFRDEAVAEEFHRRAAEAGERPSPFAARLIEQALMKSDAKKYEEESSRRELAELQELVESLRDLPRKVLENRTDNDDILAEVASLRMEISQHRSTMTPDETFLQGFQELVRGFSKLEANVAQLAELPHVFVKLREDIATGIHPLLVRSGLTRQEAEAWIRRTLLEE